MGFKIPIRFWIAVMVFFSTFANFAVRTNFSVSIPAMVKAPESFKGIPECTRSQVQTNESSNATVIPQQPDYGPRYDWSEDIQGTLLGSYYYGYSLGSIPGGWLAESLGPFKVLFWTSVATALINALCPFAANIHFSFVLVARIIIGFFGGGVYPSLQCLIARWAPPQEKGKFLSSLLGNVLGTATTFATVGAVINSWGWVWAFYIVSMMYVVYCLLLFIIVADRPDEHRWISEKEKNYILESQAGTINKKKGMPPYKKIVKSLSFWMLVILHCANFWGFHLLLNGIAKYFVEVIGFNVKNSGFLSAFPSLCRLFLGLTFGQIADIMSKKGFSKNCIRKGFLICSHFIPGTLLCMIILFGCRWQPIAVLVILSQGVNGAAVITSVMNPQDLAPNFAGTIFGMMNFICSATGFLAPQITAALIKNNNGTIEWGITFIIGGLAYIISATLFVFFGSTELQPWNEREEAE